MKININKYFINILIGAVFIILILITLSACTNCGSYEESNKLSRFETVETGYYGDHGERILRDRETGVLYVLYSQQGGYGGITVLYGPDGLPLIG